MGLSDYIKSYQDILSQIWSNLANFDIKPCQDMPQIICGFIKLYKAVYGHIKSHIVISRHKKLYMGTSYHLKSDINISNFLICWIKPYNKIISR